MAVLISDSSNPNYGTGLLNAANGFYTAPTGCYNLGAEGSGISIASAVILNQTFPSPANVKGIVLCVQLPTTYADRTITAAFQQNVAGTWTTIRSVVLNTTDLWSTYGMLYNNQISAYGCSWVAFKLATPVAVDTSSNMWRWNITQGSSALGAGNTTIRTSDNTNASYVTWVDTQATYSDTNDALVAVDPVRVTGSFRPKSYTSTGDTTFGVNMILTSNADYTNPWKLIFDAANLSGPMTWTIDGVVYMGTGAGIQVGTRASRIPNSKLVTISLMHAPTYGTVLSSGQWNGGIRPIGGRSSETPAINSSLAIAGEIPTYSFTRLQSNAALNATSITTTNSTGWSIGDRVLIAKSTTTGAGTVGYLYYTIQSISGTAITLTGGLDSARLAGGLVINLDARFGVRIMSDSPAKGALADYFWKVQAPYTLDISGFLSGGVCWDFMQGTSSGGSGTGTRLLNPTYVTQFKLEDASILQDLSTTGTNQRTLVYGIPTNSLGFSCSRVNVANAAAFPNIGTQSPMYTYAYDAITQYFPIPGVATFSNVNVTAIGNSSLGTYIGQSWTFTSCTFQNSNYNILQAYGKVSVTSCEFYGEQQSIVNGNAAGISAYGATSLAVSGCTFDNCGVGIVLNSTVLNMFVSGCTFGGTTANLYDLGVGNVAAAIQVVVSSSGTPTLALGNRQLLSDQSYIRYSNVNSVVGDNREFQAYGSIYSSGPAGVDNVVHTAGGYSMKFMPINATYPMSWSQLVPTGNIQGKTMSVGVWINVANAGYWAGTNQMPKLSVTYDGSTVVTSSALQQTGWQYVSVSFSPTTTTGMIGVQINGASSGANTAFYVDDFHVLYPPGVQLNLGAMDLWYNGTPVVPTIATNLSAADVWAENPAGFGAGTVGATVNQVSNNASLIPALL